MIRYLIAPDTSTPRGKEAFQLSAAVTAGLIAGFILLVVPRGSPWSSLTFFAPVIMGREVPPESGLALPVTMLINLFLALVCGVIISRVVANVTRLRALVTGGIVGLILYLANLGITTLISGKADLPDNELSVAFTHVVFGMIVGGAYRGLLRRKSAADSISG